MSRRNQTRDFNNDGLPDLIVTEFSTLVVYLNNGGGTFRPIPLDLKREIDSLAIAGFNAENKTVERRA